MLVEHINVVCTATIHFKNDQINFNEICVLINLLIIII